MFRLLLLTASTALLSCAPVVTVVREQRATFAIAEPERPVMLTQTKTGLSLLDTIQAFTDEGRRARHAAEAVSAQLTAAGIDVTTVPEQARTHLELLVDEAPIVRDEAGQRVARSTVHLTGEAVDERFTGAASIVGTDHDLYLAAIDAAMQQLAAALQPSQVQETFRVERGPGLEDANTHLLGGDFAQAAIAYRAHLEKNPADVLAWLNLCVALTASGDFTGAADAAASAARADTSALRINRENFAQEARDRAAQSLRVLSVTSFNPAR